MKAGWSGTALVACAAIGMALPADAQAPREDVIWARVSPDPIVLDGILDEAAWSQAELRFRLAKNGDRVRLYRMHVEDGQPRLTLIDLVELADFRAVYTRVPDGGAWQTLSVREAELGVPSSFAKPNS